MLHTFRAASLGAQGYLPGEPNNRGSWKQNNIQFVHSPATPPPPAIGPCTPVVTLTGPNPLANLGPPFAAAPACDTRTLPARIAELESVCGEVKYSQFVGIFSNELVAVPRGGSRGKSRFHSEVNSGYFTRCEDYFLKNILFL